jgi:hypothetical protein
MHTHLKFVFALGFATLSAGPSLGQSLQIQAQLADSWVVSTKTPLTTLAPFAERSASGRRWDPIANRGAQIGFAVGLVAGALYLSTRKCEELGCSIKWIAMPAGVAFCGFFGLVIGSGIDRIVSRDAKYAHPRLNVGLQFRY